jgi:hypothetical protein
VKRALRMAIMIIYWMTAKSLGLPDALDPPFRRIGSSERASRLCGSAGKSDVDSRT